ncbi:meiosis regulator and mRNA stability factor 1-like, partial [Oppia nitens]|uniref:meiosis regulator and mRNA stability factor 1-like n=1 Tax=Oppia nitens TaxID=1686743 RepID=UPI0023DC04C4
MKFNIGRGTRSHSPKKPLLATATNSGHQQLAVKCSVHPKSTLKHYSSSTTTKTTAGTLGEQSLLPAVNISLKLLATRVHHMLDTHAGSVPVHTFLDCYYGEFGELVDTVSQPLVPLEHMIACVPGVKIVSATAAGGTGYKTIAWIPNHEHQHHHHRHRTTSRLSVTVDTARASSHHHYERSTGGSGGGSGGNPLVHFTKEVRVLLKSQPHATIPFIKFVPTYHSHFVRQLCVGQFGYERLTQLMEAMPNVVQIYGEHDGRMITLTHKEQTKRFANDLIKVLKSRNGMKMKLSEFYAAYEQLYGKPFDITDYGVCLIEDILRDVWEGTVAITPFGSNDQWLALPKRERSDEQHKRTTYFEQEVIKLLRDSKESVDFELGFSMFIPAYHRFYSRQCRVSDFGFGKLIELLEELSPKILDVEHNENSGEKHLRLNYDNRLRALGARFETILRKIPTNTLPVPVFERLYARRYKSKIDYIEYYSADLTELVDKLPSKDKFRVIHMKNETLVSLMDSNNNFFCNNTNNN